MIARALLAALLACASSAAVAASEGERVGGSDRPVEPFLAQPIDMMVDEAALGEDLEGGAKDDLAPEPDATPAERAFGLFQRGHYVEAREAAEALAVSDGAMAGLLARLHAEGLGTPRDVAEALVWTERAAALGDPAARHELAVRRIDGEGVERDEERAVRELRALADEGRPEAAHDLAQLLLARPLGEDEEAERRLREAALAGLHEAQYTLALWLIGRAGGGEASAPEAVEWLVAAARGGMTEAQFELGVWLVTGRGGRRDLEAAFGWIERAALAGLPLAKQRLARMHWQGLGTPGDRIAAARWHALARADGIIDTELDAMLAGLGEEELEEAMRGLPRGYRVDPSAAEEAPRRIVRRAEPRERPVALPGIGVQLDPVPASGASGDG